MHVVGEGTIARRTRRARAPMAHAYFGHMLREQIAKSSPFEGQPASAATGILTQSPHCTIAPEAQGGG